MERHCYDLVGWPVGGKDRYKKSGGRQECNRRTANKVRPYGIRRDKSLHSPDITDIKSYGLKSAIGRPRGKGGDFRNMFGNVALKRQRRRILKRMARAEGKAQCLNTEN